MTSCDDSGLCAELDQLVRQGKRSRRSVEVGTGWTTLVDVAPLAVGHILFTAAAHIPRFAVLPDAERSNMDADLDAVVERLGHQYDGDVLVVEHGSSDRPARHDCVRHAHIHLVPVKASEQRSADAAFLRCASAVRRFDDVPTALAACRDMDTYLLASVGGATFVGIPRSVHQVARAFIADMLGLGTECVDWAANSYSKLHEMSRRDLCEEVLSHGR
jgi:diadenosine tetraphosphate (Ap4A) HIT family hydrolase